MKTIQGKALALIPARAGSKRLPGKNIRLFHGRPLIAWTIQAAIDSGCFADVMVSTDSEEIASIAKDCGAWVPFLRSAEMASDTATSMAVVLTTLQMLKESVGRSYDHVALLQPTSPLRSAKDIQKAFAALHEGAWQSVISLCEVDHPREWTGTIGPGGSLSGFFAGASTPPPAASSPQFRLNGAIYLAETEALRREETFFMAERSGSLVMPRERSIDIDTVLDFKIAESLHTFEL